MDIHINSTDEVANRSVVDVLPATAVSAVYHDAALELDEYRHNPLIRALPPYRDRYALARTVAALVEVPHEDAYRQWPDEMKLSAIQTRIVRNGIALPIQMRIVEWIHVHMRAHLHSLDPLREPEAVQRRYLAMQRGDPVLMEPFMQSHSQCWLIIGLSGVGKTTNARLALAQFPHVIIHTEFEGRPFRRAQLIYVFVTCPHNASVKSLFRSILESVDLHIGTNYANEANSRRLNAADYVQKVGAVLLRHHAGLLVIDEIQNALRRADQVEALDMLVNLLNTNSCPVLALGTPETALLAPKTLRLARRLAGHMTTIEPFKPGKYQRAEDRDRYLNSVTRLDFMPRHFEDTLGIYAKLMHYSAGIPAFITLAWTLTQRMGVESGAEMVTPKLVECAARDAFGMVKGLLSALEARNYKKLAKVGDMAIREVRERLEAQMTREEQAASEAETALDEAQVFFAAVNALVELGIGRGVAERDVAAVRLESPDADSKELARRALERQRQPSFEKAAAKSPQGSARTKESTVAADVQTDGVDGDVTADTGAQQEHASAPSAGRAARGARSDESSKPFRFKACRGSRPSRTNASDRNGPPTRARKGDEQFAGNIHPSSGDRMN